MHLTHSHTFYYHFCEPKRDSVWRADEIPYFYQMTEITENDSN